DHQHHALPPDIVADVVTHLEVLLVRPGRRRCGRPRSPAARTVAAAEVVVTGPVAPAPAAVGAGGARLAAGRGLLDERRGDLVEEAAGRVVLHAAVQRAVPGVGHVQPLTRTGDADV